MKQLELNKSNLFPEKIPEELKVLNQWVVYRLIKKQGKEKLSKVPYQTKYGKANSTNPKTWCTFEQVLEAYTNKNFDGIGFVFTKDDPYCGIDLDKCINPETNVIEPWAKNWIDKFESYTEYSPSKTGTHTIVKGKLPSEKGKKKGDYEIYDHARYFTFTGNISPEHSHIEERQNIVDEFYYFLNGEPENNKTEIPLPEGQVLNSTEIDEIIKKAKSALNGEKFSRLFDGVWKELGYPSPSEADQALCSIIAFYTDNPTAIDQVFRQSKLYREKWEREDYRENTVNNALALIHQEAKNDFQESSGSNKEVKGIPIIHIANVKHKPIEFQIDKIWPINSVGFMSGQPGIYKTWLAWDIAVCIASGTKLFDLHECKKGKVLAFNAEDDPAMVTRSRIEAIARQKRLDFEKLDLHLLDVPVITLNDCDEQKQMKITIEQYKPDMLIFDPLRNVHSLDEDNATEMSRLLRFLREINRNYSCSILLVCHDKKPGIGNGKDRAAQVRGTSALVGWRDVAIFLDKAKDEMAELQIYNRACQSILPFLFTLKAETDNQGNIETAQLVLTTYGQIEEQKDLKKLQVIKEIISEHSPMTKTDIAKAAGMNKQTCLKLVDTLIKSDDDVVVSQGGLITIKDKPSLINQVPESRNLA
ncbi:MAG: AAA family ATPase [Candidatus Scalindua sp.]|nr:AAA family ATPase [Candidatus Scalindua sp.]